MFGKFFGTLTYENIDGEIRSVANAWYIIAAIQGAVMLFLVKVDASAIENLLDPAAYAAGGYFIQTRRSRAVAVALLLLALVAFGVTIAARMGAVEGGRNVILAGIVVLLGTRSITTTWFHHHYTGARTLWTHVVAVSTGTALLSLALGFGAALVLNGVNPAISDEAAGTIIFLVVLVAFVGLMTVLTLRYPFAVRTDERLEETFE